MATLIKADGTKQEVSPRHGKNWKLEEWQKHVGGYVQRLSTNDGRVMLTNEDGKPQGLPVNEEATRLYYYRDTDFIVGDVLIITNQEFQRGK
jgi:hypothetical protein